MSCLLRSNPDLDEAQIEVDRVLNAVGRVAADTNGRDALIANDLLSAEGIGWATAVESIEGAWSRGQCVIR